MERFASSLSEREAKKLAVVLAEKHNFAMWFWAEENVRSFFHNTQVRSEELTQATKDLAEDASTCEQIGELVQEYIYQWIDDHILEEEGDG